MKVARLSIDRPVTTAMFYLALCLLGFVSLRQLSVDLLPNIGYPRLSVLTEYPGVAPEEMETLVSAPLEAAVSRVPGLRRVESVSREGVSVLTLEFAWGTDMDFTLLHAREALDSARDGLPEGAGNPVLIPMDPQSKPIMVLAVSGPGRLLDVKEFAQELVKPRLEQVEGVGSADLTGGVEREIQVEVDPKRLSLYGLTINDVADRVRAFNQNLQGGIIRKGMFEYAIRVVGEFASLDDIAAIGLKTTPEKGLVRLGDIARVEDGLKERQGITRLDRAEAIGVLVHKEAGANTVRVTRRAQAVLDQIRKENPGIAIFTVSEQASYIDSVVKAVSGEIVQGAILVFLVVFLFLQEWKTPLIINVVIPISIIATFNLLFFSNITLNIMSLGGLALGVGMLDDCADVVSENIFRHRSLGKSAAAAAYDGVREVGPAVVSTALTTIVVFLPIIFVHGVAGPLFKDAALTVSFSLLASMIVAMTLLPMLQAQSFRWGGGAKTAAPAPAAIAERPRRRRRPLALRIAAAPWLGVTWVLRRAGRGLYLAGDFLASFVLQLLAFAARLLGAPFRPVIRLAFRGFNAVYHPFVRKYHVWLVWSLDHKGTIAVATAVFFAATFSVGALLPREHMPPIKATSFELRMTAPVDYSLEQTGRVVASLEERLRSLDAVRVTFSQIGIVRGMEGLTLGSSLNSARVYVRVTSPSELEPVLQELRRGLAGFPDVAYTVGREESALAEFLAVSSGQVALKVQGDDLNRLRTISEEIVARLKTVRGLVDVGTSVNEGKPEFRITVRKDALARYPRLSVAAVSDYLVGAVRGVKATDFNELEKKYDVMVRLERGTRETVEALLNNQFPLDGALLPLRDLVTVEPARGPQEIRRENQQREILVTANLQGAKISQVVPAIDRELRRVALPEGYHVAYGGEQEEMSKSFRSLLLALVLATVLTYMIMAAQFESLLHPFLVMLTLPMGAAGAFVSLLVGGQSLNVMSIIGMVVLIGLVVDDAIVEIDFINQLRKEGRPLREAVVEGCRTRLRAILMASLDTVAGLIPMSLGLERGSELLKPLGIVVAGGLLFSTLLTLILIPVVYEAVEAARERRKAPVPSFSAGPAAR